MAFDRSKFDLFDMLAKLGKRDMSAYSSLDEEGKKAASPLVIMRWLSGTSDQAQIVRLNEFANKYVFSLGQDKDLLFKLLAASCTGKSSRFNWVKGPGSKNTKLAVQAVKSKFGCSIREADQHLRFLENSDVVQYAEEAGWDKDQLKKLQLELNPKEKK